MIKKTILTCLIFITTLIHASVEKKSISPIQHKKSIAELIPSSLEELNEILQSATLGDTIEKLGKMLEENGHKNVFAIQQLGENLSLFSIKEISSIQKNHCPGARNIIDYAIALKAKRNNAQKKLLSS